MRIQNSPFAVFMTLLAISSALFGFQLALILNIPVYIAVFAWTFWVRMKVQSRVGFHDYTWKIHQTLIPQNADIDLRHSQRGDSNLIEAMNLIEEYTAMAKVPTVAIILGIIGWLYIVAIIYLGLHLWLLHSEQLLLLQSSPVLGAVLTVGGMWLVDIVLSTLWQSSN